ncbi:MAG TPA: twin-arginine translocase TatA/TatE family subunit [Actinomycetota bacterium]|nr:twin-arginine translocase TatA/TatE family subunit [Actinomycetota bacterium]
MPQIGPLEILVVGVLALLVFGPERLPEMARSLGKGMTQLKRMASDAKAEFDMGLAAADDPVAEASPSKGAQTPADHVPAVPVVEPAARP